MPVKSAWPGIGGAHAAGPLRAVERQRVGADVRAPERLLEPIAQVLGFVAELHRELATAEPGRHQAMERLAA